MAHEERVEWVTRVVVQSNQSIELPLRTVTHLSEVSARGLHVVISRRANRLMYVSIRTSLAVRQYTAHTTITSLYGLNSAW